MSKYRRLAESLPINGTGIPNLVSTLVKRDKKVCLYERSDGNIEVFIVHTREREESFGEIYPPREVYPANEDFGSSAWCFTNPKRAEARYNKLVLQGKSSTPKS